MPRCSYNNINIGTSVIILEFLSAEHPGAVLPFCPFFNTS